MSDATVSALKGAEARGLVTLRDAGLTGMVTLRADLATAARAVKRVTGADMPGLRRITQGQGCRVAWMSPDEILILCEHATARKLAFDLTEALTGQHHLALDVSDARAMMALTGEPGPLRDVLAKITPADIAALPLGEMRRTRLQQVAGAIWFETETEARVICFRSVATYVFDLLAMSAREGGAIGYH
ncbi:sarcosine oxidase subunit gamma [Roseicyclus mahoneyensis]|uniref:Heterotetrameric sarcosine oxidase gamma subunit n=1 Tax=Roseicyclus mahoneyensis TaxID=164332 RepID=A0A316GQF3_9RHOB|nr:sarcosine oxidase subunit gamma family protein [Roseicyclus mahoneyensis]PWK62631.1 heterotetrameric sarcosine oxidase gamma subunit [Roseicyclus mahoneyensis]